MPFREVLSGLVARAPDVVRGAVFCDYEGERVEAVLNDPALDAYSLDLAGATYATLLPHLSENEDAQVRVLHEQDVVWVQLVKDGYFVVMLTRRTGWESTLGPPLREVGGALRELM